MYNKKLKLSNGIEIPAIGLGTCEEWANAKLPKSVQK